MKKKPNKPKSPLSVLMAHMGTVHMDISGNREVVFEGNKGILEYSSSSIRINAGTRKIRPRSSIHSVARVFCSVA